MMMRLKFVLGSMSPVICSTSSICCFMRFVARSIRPSLGQLGRRMLDVVPEGCLGIEGDFTEEAQRRHAR
jgi:hypothetical protein